MAPVADRPALVDSLVADPRARQPPARACGLQYVLTALTDAGRGGVIFDMASNPAAPSYAAQLAHGATS